MEHLTVQRLARKHPLAIDVGSMVMRLIVVAAMLPAAASFALGGKIDGPGKPKAAADVESGAVCKRMTESTEESIARPFRAGR